MSFHSEIIFRVGLISLFVLAVGVQFFYGRKHRSSAWKIYSPEKGAVQREGRLTLAGHVVVLLGGLWLAIIYAVVPQSVRWSMVPFSDAWRWAGLVLGMISLVGLVRVHQTLGRYWGPYLRLQESHQLVTAGVYRQVRHPMYAVLLVHTMAMALVSSNWLFSLLCLARMISIYARIGKEEAMLIERFGDDYRHYMRRTGRLLPRFKVSA